MKFSIITASFNSEKTIIRTIESLLNQSYSDFEYIIIDGCSTDGTMEIIKSYEKRFKNKMIPFTWISEKDHGIYEAWNKGLNLAKGDWISFLGSDDYYVKNALEIYNSLLMNTNESKIDWMYSNVEFIPKNKESKILDSIWKWKEFRRNIKITPAHVGSFHNREYFIKYGIYDTSYKIVGDYELLLRAKDKLKTIKAEKVTAIMSGDGVSNRNVKKALKETFLAKRKTAKVTFFLCFYDYYLSLFIHILKRAGLNKSLKKLLSAGQRN